ncbi:protein involved in polysaccharide export, contains SLBB domain of the beta-grasp fold [Abditibacterium utsteinense]|uniref:Protein involved in polysaccharide export, contains SLBB domain of the beta-grasp fold n=1 Tax=Abditibacterium utsteinense TaxID=1960156 RepID=A0A2S8SWP6_9BACT|nr:SLBB domain-containing protein [Abditibacterium utsteinense]PQV65207.1 protein involved in polysaccharide export, contains SLBB domain of the beta-grasp fold [Abditibacterium utsteinense]
MTYFSSKRGAVSAFATATFASATHSHAISSHALSAICLISLSVSACAVPATSNPVTSKLTPSSPTASAVVAKSAAIAAKSVAARGRVVTPDLILAPDDLISVSVVGHPEFSLSEATISSAGQISHPLGGLIKVGGKTLSGAALAIKKSLEVYMKRPLVTVGLVRAKPRQVFVTGAVKMPNIVTISDGWRVSEVLSAVGGLIKRPELVSLTLSRPNRKSQVLNLQEILKTPNSLANIALQPGDSLRFDEQNVAVSVVGQVAKPGAIELGVGSHLDDAILAVGGTLPRAALSKATIKRADGSVLPINLLQTAPDGAAQANPVLQTGDFISVPEQQAHVTILGTVSKPGVVDLPEGVTLRVSDALAAVGGVSIPPRMARIGVARYLPDGRLVPIAIDAQALLVDADLSQNAILKEGDLITVSPLKTRTIFVTGQVAKPGPVDAETEEGLPQLLARAGGTTSSAALRKVSVTRRGEVVASVDLLEAINGGKMPDLALQDGDYINVPRNESRVLVMPAVRNPGVYAIPEDRPLTVGDALSLAGGAQAGAKLKEVVILRQTPTGVQSQLVPLDAKSSALLSTSAVLQNGDVLYVPEAGKKGINPIDTGLRAFSTFRFLFQ